MANKKFTERSYDLTKSVNINDAVAAGNVLRTLKECLNMFELQFGNSFDFTHDMSSSCQPLLDLHIQK